MTSESGNRRQELYILGHPVAHSKSPAMHNAVIAQMGLPWHYDFANRETEEDACAFIESRDFLALNVTTPYKNLAYAQATTRAASARLVQGANLLVKKGEALIAYNVDGDGCVRYLESAGVDFSGAKVVVCGTGPTSLSILHACVQAGSPSVALLGRNRERARDVLERYLKDYRDLAASAIDLPSAHAGHMSFLQAYENADFSFGAYDTAPATIAQADVIIDATPLGMCPDDPAPFDTRLLHTGQTVMDTVYGHGTTALIAACAECGTTAHDGLGMLVAQAALSFIIIAETAGVADIPDFETLTKIMGRAANAPALP